MINRTPVNLEDVTLASVRLSVVLTVGNDCGNERMDADLAAWEKGQAETIEWLKRCFRARLAEIPEMGRYAVAVDVIRD